MWIATRCRRPGVALLREKQGERGGVMREGYPPVTVKVWGELACFTRPELKVERVTYTVPTPSAARGILEAILWKPEFAWRVEEIWVLNEVRYASFVRNEINSRQSERAAATW